MLTQRPKYKLEITAWDNLNSLQICNLFIPTDAVDEMTLAIHMADQDLTTLLDLASDGDKLKIRTLIKFPKSNLQIRLIGKGTNLPGSIPH